MLFIQFQDRLYVKQKTKIADNMHLDCSKGSLFQKARAIAPQKLPYMSKKSKQHLTTSKNTD